MSNYIVYDPNDENVPNRVIDYLKSKNDNEIDGIMTNVIKNPDLSFVSVPFYYLKVVDNQIVEMSDEEKEKIDKILRINKYAIKDRQQILNEIWGSCQSQEQQIRLLMALRKYPDVIVYLDDADYNMVRLIVQEALQNGDIIEEDADLLETILPLSP